MLCDSCCGLQTFNYNALETLLLVTSMFILLAGMTFQSGVTESGSGGHTALTVLVALVLVGCVALFVAMLGREVWNSARFARRQRRIRVAASGKRPRVVDGPSPLGASGVPSGRAQAALWTLNPLKGGSTAPGLPPPLAALPPPPPPPGPPPPPVGSSPAMGAAPAGHDKGISKLSAEGLGSQRHGRVMFVARANSVRAAAASETCGIVPEVHAPAAGAALATNQ